MHNCPGKLATGEGDKLNCAIGGVPVGTITVSEAIAQPVASETVTV
jgi:hypothetical protein